MNWKETAERVLGGEPLTLCVPLEGAQAGKPHAVPATEPTGLRTKDGVNCFVSRWLPRPLLFIVGAGHVGTALARCAAFAGYRIAAADPREELLRPERFPEGTVLYPAACDALEPILPREPACYLIASSGHRGDLAAAEAVLKTDFLYAGMLGSLRKAAMVRESLRASGFPQERIDLLHSPAGLDIGGTTPEEIAVSITAELIRCGKDREQPIQTDLLRALIGAEPGSVLVTVIRKEGSAPRGVGSRMLVRPDGSAVGTVGGGAVELQAMQLAKDCTSLRRVTFRSGRGEADRPICGGEVELLFLPLRDTDVEMKGGGSHEP